MESEGLTSTELAAKLNIQKSSISHLLSGRNKPGFDFLSKFVRVFPDINIKWLLTGEGEMKTPTPLYREETNEEETKSNHKIQGEKEEEQIIINELIKIYEDGTFEVLKPRKIK